MQIVHLTDIDAVVGEVEARCLVLTQDSQVWSQMLELCQVGCDTVANKMVSAGDEDHIDSDNECTRKEKIGG